MKAIILAAWFGTRMLPITKTIPKELLPVWNKPVIQYAVEWLSEAWIKDILMITSQWKKALEDYFDKNYELEDLLKKKWKLDLLELINKPKELANYVFIKQAEQLGTWHAVLQTRPRMDSSYFIVVYWDAIYPPEMFKDMIELHQQKKCPVVVVHEVPKEEVHKYWVIELDGDKLKRIVEKPKTEDAPSNLVSNWVFILPREIFPILQKTLPDKKSWEIYLPDAIIKLTTIMDIYTLKVRPFRDVWSPESLLKANVHFSQNWGELF